MGRIDLRFNTDTPISDAKFTYGDPAFVAIVVPAGAFLFEIGRDKSRNCTVFQTSGFVDTGTTIEKQAQFVRLHIDNPPDEYELTGIVAMNPSVEIAEPIFTRRSYAYKRLGITTSKDIIVLPPSTAGMFSKIAGPHEPRSVNFTVSTPTPRPAATPLLTTTPNPITSP